MKKFYTNIIVGLIIPIISGYIIIKGILDSPIPAEPVGWWWNVIFSVVSIGMGIYVVFFTSKYIESQVQFAKKWNAIFRMNLWPTDFDQYPFWFTRSVGIVFALIGITFLAKYLLS